MHRGATNRVRSEEAALSRGFECRGKPGPLCALRKVGRPCHPFALRLRLALTGRHWRRLLAGARFRRLPRSLLHHPAVAHMASPALFAPSAKWAGRAIARTASSRIGTGMGSAPGPDSAGSTGACSITRRSPTWQARPTLRFAQRGPGEQAFVYLRIGAADLEPARHTLYSAHPEHVLRWRRPGQSPRMPRWLRAKS